MPDTLVYPESDLDRLSKLASCLGSFWTSTYDGSAVVLDICRAKGDVERTVQRRTGLLYDVVSRFKVPAASREDLLPITLKESDRSNNQGTVARFDRNPFTFNDGKLVFDSQTVATLPSWLAPEGVTGIAVISNRITEASMTLFAGIDFVVQDGLIVFREDPFLDSRCLPEAVWEANALVDRTLQLWCLGVERQDTLMHDLFGYVLEQPGSGEAYNQLVNAVLDALAVGTTAGAIKQVWSAATGIPTAKDDETVEDIYTTDDARFLVTDKNVYRFALDVTLRHAVGDTIAKYDDLTTALRVFDLNRGQVPTPDEVYALSLGGGCLRFPAMGPLTFVNAATALQVTEDADGFTRLDWDLGGWPADVDYFFDDMHAAGVAAGETLANLLDQRPSTSRDTQPTAGALPATINPFAFLCGQVLRNNAFIVTIKTAAMRGGVGLSAAKLLRRVIPPQTAVFLIITLSRTEPPITMNDEDATSTFFRVSPYTETESVTITETPPRMRRVSGYCV